MRAACTYALPVCTNLVGNVLRTLAEWNVSKQLEFCENPLEFSWKAVFVCLLYCTEFYALLRWPESHLSFFVRSASSDESALQMM